MINLDENKELITELLFGQKIWNIKKDLIHYLDDDRDLTFINIRNFTNDSQKFFAVKT